MADTTVDSLQIEIEGNSSKAAEQVNKLAAALERLKKGVSGGKLSSAAQQIKQVGRAAQKSTPSQRKEAVEKAASGVNALKLTKDLERLDAQIGKTEGKIAELKSKFNALVEIESSYPQGFGDKERGEIDKISQKLSELRTQYAALKQQRDETFGAIQQSASTGIGGQEVERVNALRAALSALGSGAASVAKGALGAVASGAKKLGSALLDLGKKGVSAALSGLKKLGGYIGSRFTAPFKNAVKAVTTWKNALGRIAFYRIVRGAIKAITDSFKEGVDNLYQYSLIVGTKFAPAMDSLATSALYVKNSLGAMTAPIIQQLAPAVDYLADRFVGLTNAIGKAFAALTGQSVFSQAKKYATQYAEAAGDAAKATKSFTIGLDELNIIEESVGRGGKDNLDYSSMFEEVEIPSATINWAEEIRMAIEDGNWYEAGRVLAKKLNELLGNWDPKKWGRSLGEKINLGLQATYGFMQKFNFVGLGGRIADSLNGLFDSVDFDLLGRTLGKKLDSLVDVVYGFVRKFNWQGFGENIAAAINGWFDVIDFGKAGETLSNAINGIATTARSLLNKTNWEMIGGKIAEFINGINWVETLSNLGGFIADGLNAAVKTVIGLTGTLDFKGIADGIAAGIKKFINGIEWSDIGTAINNILQGALDFVIELNNELDFMGITESLGKGIGDAIANIDLFEIAKKLVAALVQASLNAQLLMPSLGAAAWDAIAGIFRSIGLDGVAGFLEGISEGIRNVVGWLKKHFVDPIVNGVKDLLGIHSPSTVFAEIGGFLVQGLFDGISEAWGTIVSFLSDSLSAFKNTISDAWTKIKNDTTTKFNDIKNTITNTFTNLKNSASTWGKDICDNLSSGIKGAIGTVTSAVSSVAGAIADFLGFSEPDKGELSNFHTFMPDMMHLMAQGIDENAHLVEGSVSDVASSILTIMSDKIPLANELFAALANGIKGHIQTTGTEYQDGLNNALASTQRFTDSVVLMYKNMADKSNSVIQSIISSLNSIPRSITTVHTIVTKNVTEGGGTTTSASAASSISLSNAFQREPIQVYAGGGYPRQGSLFIADEAGAEMVGQIGNKTAVANTEQIVDGIANGVRDANQEQNALMREQNELLRALLAKDNSVRIGDRDIKRAYDRASRNAGASIMPGGVLA